MGACCSRSRPRSAARLGLYAYYRGMRLGAMSVVAPIAGASAIIPVVFGIATGDRPSPLQIGGIACAIVGVALASHEHHEGSRRVAAGVGLALLAALGFGFYFPPMHAAGKVDFWWASLVFRATALALVAASRRRDAGPQLRLGRGPARLRPRRRDRRHARQRPLRRLVGPRTRQPHRGARLALPDRDGDPRRGRPARARRAAAEGRDRADADRRRADLRLGARR